jgi:hypothetical protein
VCFFLHSYRQLNKGYRSLFGQGDTEDGEGDEIAVERNAETFEERWGWIYNAELIAGFERIKMGDVWELPIIQALNTLAYLKDKSRNEREQIEKINKKNAKS